MHTTTSSKSSKWVEGAGFTEATHALLMMAQITGSWNPALIVSYKIIAEKQSVLQAGIQESEIRSNDFAELLTFILVIFPTRAISLRGWP